MTIGNRIVGLNEIIPTIYRYAQENYGVTIVDNGEIVARFDLDTENMCNIWPNRTTSDDRKNQFVKYINDNILDYVKKYGKNVKQYNVTDVGNLFSNIYKQTGSDRLYYCGWNDKYSITKRIDSDLSRKNCFIFK